LGIPHEPRFVRKSLDGRRSAKSVLPDTPFGRLLPDRGKIGSVATMTNSQTGSELLGGNSKLAGLSFTKAGAPGE